MFNPKLFMGLKNRVSLSSKLYYKYEKSEQTKILPKIIYRKYKPSHNHINVNKTHPISVCLSVKTVRQSWV